MSNVRTTHPDLPSHVGIDLCHILLPAHKRSPYPIRLYPGPHLMATTVFNVHLPLLQPDDCSMTVPWGTDGKLQNAATKIFLVSTYLLVHQFYCHHQLNLCVAILITHGLPVFMLDRTLT